MQHADFGGMRAAGRILEVVGYVRESAFYPELMRGVLDEIGTISFLIRERNTFRHCGRENDARNIDSAMNKRG